MLSFAKDCWLELVVDGVAVPSELKAGGETVSIEADEFVALTLGNSSVVSVEVNGRPFPCPRARRGSSAICESIAPSPVLPPLRRSAPAAPPPTA